MHSLNQMRRRLMFASLAWPIVGSLDGCGSPLGPMARPDSVTDAHELLLKSAVAHGLAAFAHTIDINVSYVGRWRPVVGKLQPALTDPGFRGASEERLLPRDRVTAQAFTGPSGRKHVVRTMAAGAQGDVRVWFNGTEAQDEDRRAAAALVADGYGLFLLGPLLLASHSASERELTLELGNDERVVLDNHPHQCDVLRLRMRPGLGLSAADELALFIDRETGLMRRVRFTLDGLESTRGAIAEVDTFDHIILHGITWPTRFHERLRRPLPLPVHDWHLTGLDVNRSLTVADVGGAEFEGGARQPAAALP